MNVKVFGAAAALLACGAVWAQGLDRDGDGTVTYEEFQAAHEARLHERFAALDKDGDGKLSAEEQKTRPQMGMRDRRGGPRAAIDADGDGSWSLAELQAVRPGFTPEQFNRLDANAVGLISADERPAFGRPGTHGPRPPRPSAD